MLLKTSFMANGNIRPSRFVKQDTTANFKVLEADANERTIGVSNEATREAPISGSSTYAAIAGQELGVYGPGDECYLEIGSGGCVAGDLLTPDADGKGVINTTDKRWYGARALETASENEFAKVLIEHGYNAV